jgi:hypothetical protein
MSMIKCAGCNNQVASDFRNCPVCGTPVPKGAEPPIPRPKPPRPAGQIGRFVIQAIILSAGFSCVANFFLILAAYLATGEINSFPPIAGCVVTVACLTVGIMVAWKRVS